MVSHKVLYHRQSATIVTTMKRDIHVWDGPTGNLVRIFRHVSHRDISGVAFDATQGKIIVTDHSGDVIVLRFAHGTILKSFHVVKDECDDMRDTRLNGRARPFSSASRAPYHHQHDKEEHGQEAREDEGASSSHQCYGTPSCLHYCEEDRTLLTTSWDQSLRLYDDDHEDDASSWTTVPPFHCSNITTIPGEVNHDVNPRPLDHVLSHATIKTRKPLRHYKNKNKSPKTMHRDTNTNGARHAPKRALRSITHAHDSEIMCLAFSYSLSLIATASSDGMLKVWDYVYFTLEQEMHVEAMTTTMQDTEEEEKENNGAHASCCCNRRCRWECRTMTEIHCVAFVEPYPMLLVGHENGSISVVTVRPHATPRFMACIHVPRYALVRGMYTHTHHIPT
jgi:WD40 repeat protein